MSLNKSNKSRLKLTIVRQSEWVMTFIETEQKNKKSL